MHHRRVLSLLIVLAAAAVQLAPKPVPTRSGTAIPDAPYRSWSLFLVCNPEWLTTSKGKDLQDLFERFEAFAETTGEDHAAVWFFRQDRKKADDLDTARMTKYCGHFGLVPSQGPHIVVTTVHPDTWKASAPGRAGDARIVVGFGGKSAKQIQVALTKLDDQVAAHRLSEVELASQQYWLSWVDVFEKTCAWLDKVKISVDAKVVKVERTGICS